MKNKNNVFNTFKVFHVLIEREIVKTLKCMKSINEGEYCSNEFLVYCDKCNIRHEKIISYTSQLNRMTEKMNKIIIERVRCMLFTVKLLKGL